MWLVVENFGNCGKKAKSCKPEKRYDKFIKDQT